MRRIIINYWWPIMYSIAILGSTGSIGRNALRVIDALGPDYKVAGLSAHTSVELLAQQARHYRPQFVAVTHPDSAESFRALTDGLETEILIAASWQVRR